MAARPNGEEIQQEIVAGEKILRPHHWDVLWPLRRPTWSWYRYSQVGFFYNDQKDSCAPLIYFVYIKGLSRVKCFPQANKMSSTPLTFGVFAKQLKRCKRKLGLASNNIKYNQSIFGRISQNAWNLWKIYISILNFTAFLQQRAASMLTFFLRCPQSTFDVFVITIIIIMILAHLPIKSLVALKRIETQGLGTPGESLVSLRVRFMSRCQFLIMSLAFNLETVNHKNYTVSFFWSKFVQRCWREGSRGDGHLAFPLAKGAYPAFFLFLKLEKNIPFAKGASPHLDHDATMISSLTEDTSYIS